MMRFRTLAKIILLAGAMILAAGLSTWVVFTFLTSGGEVEVPDLRGKNLEAALESTSRLNLGMRIARTGFDESIPPGQIINQDPRPGTRTRKSRVVRVVVSQGTRTVYVPNLTGLNPRRVELLLSQAGLKIGMVSRTYNFDKAPETVVAQSPLPDSFTSRGDEVDILISEGKRPLIYYMEDLTGFPMEDVIATLRAWGLKPGRIRESESRELPSGTVIALEPPEGSAVTEGQTVHLTIAVPKKRETTLPIFIYRYQAPPGLLDRVLTLVLITDEFENTVYEDTVPAGTSVSIPVSLSKKGILRVMVDGSLFEEREVP
ncbi:MAG: PASTA domain-containing protein [bacterium]